MRQGGFSYVVMMFLVAVLSIVSLRALESTSFADQREKEMELLWRGMAYRDAIRDYYMNGPGVAKVYPKQLKDMLYDTRLIHPRRPLRKLYRDPMSSDGEWGLVRNTDGGLIGVYSKSARKPLKQGGFPRELASFANAQHYSDWQFVFKPQEK